MIRHKATLRLHFKVPFPIPVEQASHIQNSNQTVDRLKCCYKMGRYLSNLTCENFVEKQENHLSFRKSAHVRQCMHTKKRNTSFTLAALNFNKPDCARNHQKQLSSQTQRGVKNICREHSTVWQHTTRPQHTHTHTFRKLHSLSVSPPSKNNR